MTVETSQLAFREQAPASVGGEDMELPLHRFKQSLQVSPLLTS